MTCIHKIYEMDFSFANAIK